jgi:spermidine/putrescine-binding protein
MMAVGGKEDRELNLLLEGQDRRVGRRGFLRTAALLGAAGAAGYAGGTVAGILRDDGGQPAAPAPVAQPVPGNRRNERLLNIYNWNDYIDDRTVPLFQALTNIRVNYDVYSSNEDLLAKLQAGPTDYDIVVPTSWFIPTYRQLGLIEPLRQDLIPNLTNLDREFVETDYDPGNRYSIPWQWGTVGIGYNRLRVPGGAVDSWAAVFEPLAAMGGHISLLREVTDLIGTTLIYLGKSPNSSRDADLAEVVRLLQSVKPKLSKFTADTYIDELAAGETWLAQGWSGDVFQAQDQNPDVSYTIPKEGSLRFVDVMCIPKGAPHPGNAARFMNYVLHPKVQARISKYVSYGTPVSLAGVGAHAGGAVGAGQPPGDLPADLDQAVDRHRHRPEAPQVAGRLRPGRERLSPWGPLALAA